MSLKYTMQTAMDCVQYMNESGFVPGSILNIGVSSAPECRIWKRLYSDVPVIGIDPKAPRSWVKFPYIQAVATDKTSESIQFCWKCFSLVCLRACVWLVRGFARSFARSLLVGHMSLRMWVCRQRE